MHACIHSFIHSFIIHTRDSGSLQHVTVTR